MNSRNQRIRNSGITVALCVIATALTACSSMPSTASRMTALMDANARYDAALVAEDAAALEGLYADDFLSITTPSDEKRDKQQQITTLTSGGFDLLDGKSSEVEARIHGDTATLIGKFSGRYTASGQNMSFVERYTSTWSWQDGVWRLVLEHGAILSETK